MAGPLDRDNMNASKKGGFSLDPITAGMTILGGASNLLGGNAARKAQKQQFDAQRNDAQRQAGMDAAQFAARLGFDRDQDQFSRAKDVYTVSRDREADAFKRQQTNALNPARRDLIGALMQRFTGGQAGDWSKMFASQPGVSERANYGGVEDAAKKEYTRVANPIAQEQERSQGKVDAEAMKRAEGSIQNRMRMYKSGERSPQKDAQILGFDPLDPANRDKWLKAFLDDDDEYQKLNSNVSGQYGRMGSGIKEY